MKNLKRWAHRNPDLATIVVAAPLAALAGWYFISLTIYLGGL